MPGWTSPDSIASAIDDLQSRVRRLETYNAAPLYASSTLWTQLGYQTWGSVAGVYTSSWAPLNMNVSYTLSVASTVMFVAIVPSFSITGGTAPWGYIGYSFDGATPTGVGSVNVAAGNGGHATVVAQGPHQAAGAHSVGLYYVFDAGYASTQFNVNAFSQAPNQGWAYQLGG